MKLSVRAGMYMGVLLLLFLAGMYAKGNIRMALWALWSVLAFSGGVYVLYWARGLEQGIEKMDDLESFRTYVWASGDRTANDMLKGIEKQTAAVKGRYSAKVMDRQSEINSLQSQINPHFLYNTLECIRSEAVVQNCDSIANMAKSLASFFRYSISRRENIVTLADELNNIKNYFLIQNYRFENKFQLFIQIEDEDEAVYSYLIPKMTIQPIVENSIFHGLETKSGDCQVKISICTTEDKVLLMISDNGIGMSEESLAELRNRMESGQKAEADVEEDKNLSSEHGSGIALYNVNQRIKLSFGAMYGLQVYSILGAGTDIEIILPMVTS
ncbi:MAG: sensor histidine kinase [Lachnospiraceae bacterium]